MNKPIYILGIEQSDDDFFVNSRDPNDRQEYPKKDEPNGIISNQAAWEKSATALGATVVRYQSVVQAGIRIRKQLEKIDADSANKDRPRVLCLIGHGRPGAIALGAGQASEAASVLDAGVERVGHFRQLRPHLQDKDKNGVGRGDELRMLGCSVGIGHSGQLLMFSLANSTGIDVRAALGSVWWGHLTMAFLDAPAADYFAAPHDADAPLVLADEKVPFEDFPHSTNRAAPSNAKIIAYRPIRPRTLTEHVQGGLAWQALTRMPGLPQRFPNLPLFPRREEGLLEPGILKGTQLEASAQMLLRTGEVILEIDGVREVWGVITPGALLSPLKNNRRSLFLTHPEQLKRELDKAIQV